MCGMVFVLFGGGGLAMVFVAAAAEILVALLSRRATVCPFETELTIGSGLCGSSCLNRTVSG